jgi:hypothetical protein
VASVAGREGRGVEHLQFIPPFLGSGHAPAEDDDAVLLCGGRYSVDQPDGQEEHLRGAVVKGRQPHLHTHAGLQQHRAMRLRRSPGQHGDVHEVVGDLHHLTVTPDARRSHSYDIAGARHIAQDGRHQGGRRAYTTFAVAGRHWGGRGFIDGFRSGFLPGSAAPCGYRQRWHLLWVIARVRVCVCAYVDVYKLVDVCVCVCVRVWT